MLRLIVLTGFVLMLSACVSVARVEDFPASSNDINFTELSEKSFSDENAGFYTTDFEDFTQVCNVTKTELFEAIHEAIEEEGYNIKKSNQSRGVVIGEINNISMTKYLSVSGVYVKENKDGFLVYVRTRLTHSITPGWATKYNMAPQ